MGCRNHETVGEDYLGLLVDKVGKQRVDFSCRFFKQPMAGVWENGRTKLAGVLYEAGCQLLRQNVVYALGTADRIDRDGQLFAGGKQRFVLAGAVRM